MSAPGSPICPAYLAPVKPANGLFAVPAAIFVGTAGTAGADAAAGATLLWAFL
jgi:hypothetical protein